MKAPRLSVRETLQSKLASGRLRFASAWSKVRSWKEHAKRWGQRWYAIVWQRIYAIHHGFLLLKVRYWDAAITALLVLLVVVSGYMASPLRRTLESYFSTEAMLSGFRTFFVTLGGALLGAAAIAFSLVMFAIQVNVDRMPHGLFRKLSSDHKLLSAFAIIFILAIAIAAMSLIPDTSWLAVATLTTCWGLILILILFFYAYKRALGLISPSQQLNLVLTDARRDLHAWERRARRAAPLLTGVEQQNERAESPMRSAHDLKQTAYFKINPHWTAIAQKAILYAISFSRRYAEQGDHEVSRTALSAVVSINAAYIDAKGKTFFTNNQLFENPLASDGFINDTLEHLRQNVQIGISRGDEQLIEQTLRTMTALHRIYMNIDYATEDPSKTHAAVAAAYLSSAVESVVSHNMPDVIMEGVRLMGETGQNTLDKGDVHDIAAISERIALLSCVGVIKEDYRPVTLTGVEQLAKFTFALIRNGTNDVGFAAREIKSDVSLVAETFLKLPDTPFSSIHSRYLAPYYSATSSTSLQTWLTDLANAVAEANANNETAKRIIGNIESWSEDIYQAEKEIFLLAVEKKSHFTFDIIHWIAHIAKLLMAVSNSPACKDYIRERLRRNALWLISVLSWVPGNKEAIALVENYGMTETLFDSSADAQDRDCDEVANQVRDLLIAWAFKAGKYETGSDILERSLYGLVTLDFMRESDGTEVLADISAQLTKENALDQSIRDRTAREIRARSASHYQRPYPLSRIEYEMGQVDEGKLRPLLVEIANLLSPGTANEPVRRRAF